MSGPVFSRKACLWVVFSALCFSLCGSNVINVSGAIETKTVVITGLEDACSKAGIPGAVIDLTIEVNSHSSIKVTWKPPVSASCVIGYVVTLNGGNEQIVPATEFSYEYTTLLSCTEYEITVTATSDEGDGPPSSHDARTLSPAELSPVGDVKFNDDDVDNLVVTWTPVVAEEACIKEYKVEVDGTEVTPAPQGPTHTITTPVACQIYVVSVVAVPHDTGTTESQPTVASYTTKGGVPGAVTDYKVDSSTIQSVQVSWSQPIHHACVTGYNIKISGSSNIFDLPPGTRAFEYSDLLSCTEYAITVNAISYEGNGSPSALEVTTNSPKELSPVDALTFEEITNNLVLIWTPLIEEQACIKEYKVQVNGEEVLSLQEPTYTILNAKKCQTHIVSVIAVPLATSSAESIPIVGVYTTGKVPGAVTDFKVDSITTESLRVSWSAPEEPACVIGYQLKISDSEETVDLLPGIRSYEYADLLSCTVYEITVTAKTQYADGVPSVVDTKTECF